MNQAGSRNDLFPIFLKVEKLRVLIVGGGDVGSEKLRFLLKSSPLAKVTLVAIEVSNEITNLSLEFPDVTIIKREFDSVKGTLTKFNNV